MAATKAEPRGLYVYGVTLTDVACDGQTVDVGRLRAVVSEEPLDRYEPEAIDAAVREPGWLEDRLRAHDAALVAVQATGPVAPFRFGTIFRTEAELRSSLARAEARLARRLVEFRGASEWGVKTWVEDELLHAFIERHDDGARRGRAELDAATEPGRRYLLERKHGRRVSDQAAELAIDRAFAAHAALAAEAREAQAERPSAFDSSDGRRPVLRGSYLVGENALERFRRVLAEVQERDAELGIDYALSGPWPPYSFVDVELS